MKCGTKMHLAWLSPELVAIHLGFVNVTVTVVDGEVVATAEPDVKRLYEAVRRLGIKKHRSGRSMRFRVVDWIAQ